MDARHVNLLKFVKDAAQFVIPIYQRKYSWERSHCQQLWQDIQRAGHKDTGGPHFVGSVVYVADTDAHNASLLVIDGQQRLTTLTLLLAALQQKIGDTEPFEDFSANKILGYYLSNPLETGPAKRKLVLSETDSETLFSIIDRNEFPENASRRIQDNFDFFVEQLTNPATDIETICRGLSRLLVVYVALSRKEDNPQLIFESMNSTGRALAQADLIRNFILMGLETELQTRLYNDYWRRMEVAFGQEGYDKHFNRFMRYYLIVKTGNIPNVNDVYTAFKEYAHTAHSGQADMEMLVRDIKDYSQYYAAMALGKETDKELNEAFHDLRELQVDVAYPLLLELYADFKNNSLHHDDFLKAVRLIESYVFRRAVCDIPTNSLNKTFAFFGKSLRKDRYLESIEAQFLLMPSYRRFPGDEEFSERLKHRDLYHFGRRSYWLRRMENFGRKERVQVDEYTIEHIMPQNQNMPDGWKKELGDEWQSLREKYLHTLGNLTLTGYNSEYQDHPFAQKRDMKGGFAESPLRMNEGLGQEEAWNETAIQKRADKLAKKAEEVWLSPRIDKDTLNSYRPEEITQSDYTIDDHPNLLQSPTRELFDALRKEIMQLDPCISEEFLKLYIAYKTETNFVDIVPQAKGLLLNLNIDFVDINDQKGICRDVTGIGRWGNGDTQVKFQDISELSYMMGLIRQALERQMDNEV